MPNQFVDEPDDNETDYLEPEEYDYDEEYDDYEDDDGDDDVEDFG